MELKRIHLKNYRRYKDEIIEFPTGIIGIVGRNGSGKSTMIEAIGWCMYGNDAARTKKDEIKTTGIPAGEDCSVTLEIILGSDVVRIIRELRGKNASGYASVFLNEDMTPHVRGVKEVSEFVAKRTGMDHVAFFTSVFAKQKELDALSELQPEKRKKTIMRLLRIDRIDDAIGAIRDDIKESKARISLLEGSNPKDMELLKRQQLETSEQSEQTTQQINAHADTIKKLAIEEKKRKTEFSVQKKKYQKHNKANNELVKIEAQIRSKNDEKKRTNSDLGDTRNSEKKLREILPRVKEYAAIKKEKDALDVLYGSFTQKKSLEDQRNEIDLKITNMISANKQIGDTTAKLHDLESTLKIQEDNLADQKSQEEKLVKTISAGSAKIQEEKKQRSALESEFVKIKDLGGDGTCPTCSRPLKDYFTHASKYFVNDISVLNERIKADLKKKKESESSLQSLKKNIGVCSKRIKNIETMIKKNASLQVQLNEGKKSLAAATKEKSILVKKLEKFSDLTYNRKHHLSINKQFTKLSEINDKSIKLSTDAKRIPLLSKRQKELSEKILWLERRQKEVTQRLDLVGYDRLEHEKSEKSLEQSSTRHSEAREELIRLKGTMDNIALKIKQIDDQIKDESNRRVTIDEENKKINSRGKLEQIMKDFRLELISRIKPILTQRSSELFKEITRGRYSTIDLDEDYNIIIVDNGGRFTTDRFSGGEGDLANLCLRIAISQELTERSGGMQANFIALDEIFGSQDVERKRSILEALSMLSGQFKQILVITHVEDVKEVLPYVLAVKEGPENMIKIEAEGIAQV